MHASTPGEREYRYFIETRKNPFTRHATWQYYVPLDLGRMNHAAASLLEYDDFTSFAQAQLEQPDEHLPVLRADGRPTATAALHDRADRFLRNLMRSIVGTLVGCGARTLHPEEFRAIVESPRPVAVERPAPRRRASS